MPIIQSAKKALRSSKRKMQANQKSKKVAKDMVRSFRKSPNIEKLKKAYSALDRLAKKRIFHQNKVDRLKSRLAKLIKEKAPKKAKKSSPKKKGSVKKASGAKKMAKR